MKLASRIKQLSLFMMMTGCITLADRATAAAFQLWEQDGASVGNYHAGRAAISEDASTAFYNPAGLVKIPNQEVVVGVVPITTAFKFDGTVSVNGLDSGTPMATTAQGGTLNFVPDLHYAAPLTSNLVFGLSIAAPFGLQTNYGSSTVVRYSATKTSLQVVDLAPALGFAITPKLSIGAGADIEFSKAKFNLVGTALDPVLDTDALNTLNGHGLGYHAGILYQFTPGTRLGLAYQSKVTHHFNDGTSKFVGPLANDADGGVQENNNLKTDATIPATTTLSFFSALHPKWDVMATVSYTQWSVFNEVNLFNVSGIDGDLTTGDIASSDTITVTIPQNYHNTWNYSVGANYHVNEQWFIRMGGGFDETPSNNEDRNLQLPDFNRKALALGTHYQASQALGFDVGWTHFFSGTTSLDVTQAVGAQVTQTKGTVNGNADVYGFQLKWDIV